jgi:hypothetical protein
MNTDDQLFTQLVSVFYSSAMMALGKLKNPVSDKIERNLEQAKISIDILELIREKTKNNLTETQQRMIDGILTDLRLNYIDETNKDLVRS